MDAPKSLEMPVIQSWVLEKTKYTGKKAEMARTATVIAMEWWQTRSDGYLATVGKRKAKKDCKAFVKKGIKSIKKAGPAGSLFAAIVLAIFMNVMISSISRVILDWLFRDTSARKVLRERRDAFFDKQRRDRHA
jgi:hypothetical protein